MGVLFDAYRKHISGTKPLRTTPTIELDIILDVLDGCDMKCPGCFVETKNKFNTFDLERIYRLTQEFKDNGIEANELFLGPTDIFNTTNFEEVVREPLFDKLTEQYAALTFTSTMLGPTKELSVKVDKLMSIMAPYGKRFELFVILDIEKYIADDRAYLDEFDRNLELIKNIDKRLTKQVNIFFIANFYPEMFNNISIYDLSVRLKRDYGTKFKINPSFARATNSLMIERNGVMLKDLLHKQVNDTIIRDVFLNMADVYFGGDTFHPLTYTEGRLFIAPFMYEFIALKRKELEIECGADGFFHMVDVFKKRNELVTEQYMHSETVDECTTCEFLPNCISRNHIQFMKLHKINKCIVPKKLYRNSYKVMENTL